MKKVSLFIHFRVTNANLPRDKDGDPYRPFPCPIRGLEDQMMDKISCAVTHNLALDNKVRVYLGSDSFVMYTYTNDHNENRRNKIDSH